jgi:hypothetical protein
MSLYVPELFVPSFIMICGKCVQYVVDLCGRKPACSSVSRFWFSRYQLSRARIILSWILASIEVSAIGL